MPNDKAHRAMIATCVRPATPVPILKQGYAQLRKFDEETPGLASWKLSGNTVIAVVSDKAVLMMNISQVDLINAHAQTTNLIEICEKNPSCFDERHHHPFTVTFSGQHNGIEDPHAAAPHACFESHNFQKTIHRKYTGTNEAVFVDGTGRVPKVYIQDELLVDPYGRSHDPPEAQQPPVGRRPGATD